MNKQELIDYCKTLKEDKNRFINCIDVDRIIKKIEQLDESQKVKIPQFVAEWYEENKDVFEENLYRCAYNIPSVFDSDKLNEFERWFLTAGKKPFQTLVNIHQFGYEVEKEKEKRYEVILCNGQSLKTVYRQGNDRLDFEKVYDEIERFTRKQLEEAGFGWVFDCPGIKIKEVIE
jgi:phage protein